MVSEPTFIGVYDNYASVLVISFNISDFPYDNTYYYAWHNSIFEYNFDR